MDKKGTLRRGDIMQAIPNLEEEIALARPRTKKISDAEAIHFGERLMQIRRVRGLSQMELAEKTGLHQTHVSHFERGERRPDAGQLATIAKVLRTSTDELLGLSKTKANGKPLASRSVLRRLRQIEVLPRRDKDALLRVIDNTLGNVRNGQRVAA